MPFEYFIYISCSPMFLKGFVEQKKFFLWPFSCQEFNQYNINESGKCIYLFAVIFLKQIWGANQHFSVLEPKIHICSRMAIRVALWSPSIIMTIGRKTNLTTATHKTRRIST